MILQSLLPKGKTLCSHFARLLLLVCLSLPLLLPLP